MSGAASLETLSGGTVFAAVYLWLPGASSATRVLIPAAGASAHVYVAGTTTPVDVFEDATLTGPPLAQPLTADDDGRLPGFVAQPEALDIALSGAGLTPRTVRCGIDAAVLALTDVHVVGSDAAMLAIPGVHEGSVAIRTDLENKVFMNNGGVSGTDADWTQIGFGNVLSVNGASGDVTIHLQDLAATADVALGGHKLTGVGDATAGTDALNRETGDGRYDLAGAAAAAQAAAEAASLPAGTTLDAVPGAVANVDLHAHKLVNVADATAGTDALNRETADGRYDAAGAAAAAQAAAIASAEAASDPVGSAAAAVAANAGGAATPSHGRASTIAAPTLRDFVSIMDFAPHVDGATDDHTIIQNANNTAGAFTLYFPVGVYAIANSITCSRAWKFEQGANLKKTAAFADAQGILMNGGTASIEAPVGSLVIDGNQAGGAAGTGIVAQNGTAGVLRGGQYNNNKAGGVSVGGAATDLRCYQVEASFNIAGNNTGNGFGVSGGKLRTWGCIANQNDRWGFWFDRTAQPGCRLDGYAFGNQQMGANIRSFRGHCGQFVADANVGGGLYVDFGGCAWEFEEIRASNSGLGDSVIQLVTTANGSNVVTLNGAVGETWWGGQVIEGINIPAGTTVVGPVAAGANTLTISNNATADGQTTVGIGKTSASGVQFNGASMCQVGQIIERNSAGYGMAMGAMGAAQATAIANGGNPITASQSTIPCTAGLSAMPLGGVCTVGAETIIYEGVVSVAGVPTMIGVIRGAFGTTAAVHADTTAITQTTAPMDNSVDFISCNNRTSWDSDPALFMAAGAERNHVGTLDVHGRTIAWSIGEAVGAGNYNKVGVLLADTCSTAIWRVSNGSNNSIGRVEATDCWTASVGIAPALLYFLTDGGATTTGNVCHHFEHKTINRPAPGGIIQQAGTASGNYLVRNAASSTLSLEGQSWMPAGAITETFSRTLIPANQTGFLLTSGKVQMAGGCVIPAGKAVTSQTIYSGGTGLTMGTNGDGHLWFCLVRQSDGKIVAISNDQGGSATWSASTGLTLNWTSSYTDATWSNFAPVADTPVYVGVMVNVGTGGTPTLPTIAGINYNAATNPPRGLPPVLSCLDTTTGRTTAVATGTVLSLSFDKLHMYGIVS